MNDGVAKPLTVALEFYYDELTAYVRRKVSCPETAADIVQEAYIRLASGQVPATVDNPRAFLYRIVGNLALDHLRRQRTRARYFAAGPPPSQVADDRPSAESRIDGRQRLAALARAVDELPPRCREIFVLRKFEGLAQATIARRLGISRSMVEKHLRKALLHCALRLRELD